MSCATGQLLVEFEAPEGEDDAPPVRDVFDAFELELASLWEQGCGQSLQSSFVKWGGS